MPLTRNDARFIQLVRAWAITVLAIVLVAVGIIKSNPSIFMVGFTVLGAEPMARAREEIHD
jgi:hypothetical protein